MYKLTELLKKHFHNWRPDGSLRRLTQLLDRWFTFSAFHVLPTIPHSFPQFSIPRFTFRIPRSAIPHFTNSPAYSVRNVGGHST